MEQFEQKVVELLSAEGCGIFPKEEIDLSKSFMELGFDSLKFAEFLVHLESDSGKEIPDEILNLSLAKSVEQFIEVIFAKTEG